MNGERELYDNEADPYQLVNLAGLASTAALRATLGARTALLATCAGQSCVDIENLPLDSPTP